MTVPSSPSAARVQHTWSWMLNWTSRENHIRKEGEGIFNATAQKLHKHDIDIEPTETYSWQRDNLVSPRTIISNHWFNLQLHRATLITWDEERCLKMIKLPSVIYSLLDHIPDPMNVSCCRKAGVLSSLKNHALPPQPHPSKS